MPSDTPSIFSISPYARFVAEDMYPGQAGQDDQNDAARHMLAAGTLARKYGVGPAEFLGRAHEYTTSPIAAFKALIGAGKMPKDYDQDMHNNALGARLGARARSQTELEDMVNQMAEQATKKQTTGKPWISRAEGGSVDLTRPFVDYPSARRRPEARNDREAAANAPLSALRGWAAGTLGLPGDLESLVRMIPGLGGETYMPTTDDIRKILPGRSLESTPTGRAFTELGTLTGGAGLATGAKLSGRGAGALGRLTAEQIVRGVEGGNPLFAAVAPAYVVKPKGGNFLSGSIERVVEPMKTRVIGSDPAARLRDLDASYAQNLEAGVAMDADVFARERARLNPEIAINKWLDTKLAKYMRNEMATPEDPVRELAERGVLHFEPVPTSYNVSDARVRAGFPEEGLAQSELAKLYEKRADTFYNELQAQDLTSRYPEIVAKDPWLAKVPPETRVYELLGGVNNELGMQHLVDELKNAINPASGLPENLRLKYSDLEKVTVPQAVERVAKINDWRAAQQVEANMIRAMNPATQIVKEYPESGTKWVELRQPKELPEGYTLDKAGNSIGPDGNYAQNPGEKQLEDALKYEGEIMGHCVGGYCPDVVEGRSKIFSLRDDKGRPHVTIETAPGPKIFDTGTPEGRPGPEKIVQIKGKGNRAPVKEYLPAVQDFVKSGEWSDVGDLQNTGLIDARVAGKPLPGKPAFMTEDDFKAYQAELGQGGPPPENFARGGEVHGFSEGGAVSGANFPTVDFDPARIDSIVGEFHAMNAR